MRVFTCTPKPFIGNAGHFARESGLFSVGLNLIGVESRAIMPGPPMEDDDPHCFALLMKIWNQRNGGAI